jgi:hypothetical protein
MIYSISWTATNLKVYVRVLVLLIAAPLVLQACGSETPVADPATAAIAQSASSDSPTFYEKIATLVRVGGARRNKAPSISGTPVAQVVSGATYAFVPSAADPNGDPLTFSIANKPAWAAFSSGSGLLTGTPATTQVGTTAGIVISVSDGRATTSLPAFSIQVVNPTPPPPTTYAVTVSWAAPTTNVDGTPLADLSGFKLYYGQSAQALDRVLQIGTPSTTSQSVQNLASGTWYFAVAAVNATGLESALSSIATKAFP